nr:hypothetical protein CFP56_79243 [Quercus suber]
MPADLLEGGLDAPAHDEPREDRLGGEVDVGAQERLRVTGAGRIAHQHPADRLGRQASLGPERRRRGVFEPAGLAAVPFGQHHLRPDGGRVAQHGVELGHPLSLQGGAAASAGDARGGGFEQVGVEAQPRDQGDVAAHGGDEVERSEAAVGHHGDAALPEPATALQDGLTRPVGQGLVAPAMCLAPTLRGGQHGEKGQRPAPAREGHREHDGQHEPAQPAGLDEVALRRADRVTVDAPRRDLRPPPPLDRIVDADDHLAVRQQHGDEVPEQPARHVARIPPRPAQDVVVAAEAGLSGQSHHAKCPGDGAPAGRQHCAGHQHEDAAPDRCSEARAQYGQPCRQYRRHSGEIGTGALAIRSHPGRRVASPLFGKPCIPPFRAQTVRDESRPSAYPAPPWTTTSSCASRSSEARAVLSWPSGATGATRSTMRGRAHPSPACDRQNPTATSKFYTGLCGRSAGPRPAPSAPPSSPSTTP